MNKRLKNKRTILLFGILFFTIGIGNNNASAVSLEVLIKNDSLISAKNLTYPIVDTHQSKCYDASVEIVAPLKGEDYYGQDAQYDGYQPSYKDNGDGTVSDNITRLMWSQSPDLNGDGKVSAADKLSYKAALEYAKKCNLGGYSDWRIPTIKELYSLIDFSGFDPS